MRHHLILEDQCLWIIKISFGKLFSFACYLWGQHVMENKCISLNTSEDKGYIMSLWGGKLVGGVTHKIRAMNHDYSTFHVL